MVTNEFDFESKAFIGAVKDGASEETDVFGAGGVRIEAARGRNDPKIIFMVSCIHFFTLMNETIRKRRETQKRKGKGGTRGKREMECLGVEVEVELAVDLVETLFAHISRRKLIRWII